MTSKDKTYNMLKSRHWIHGRVLEDEGGSLRRLRELRDEYEIKSRRVPGAQSYEYRLVGKRQFTFAS